MPRQQQQHRRGQSTASVVGLPLSAVTFFESPSATGRLAFAEVTLDEHTFQFFKGLKLSSFVILRPKKRGDPLRVYGPSHTLPNGKNFQHLQGDPGVLTRLRDAIRVAYETTNAASGEVAEDDPSVDDESAATAQTSDDDVPF